MKRSVLVEDQLQPAETVKLVCYFGAEGGFHIAIPADIVIDLIESLHTSEAFRRMKIEKPSTTEILDEFFKEFDKEKYEL